MGLDLEFAPRGRLAHDLDDEADTGPVRDPRQPWSHPCSISHPSLSFAIPATAVVASLIVVRLLAGDQPIDLAVLFGQRRGTMPWPRGVQEEEPRPWRFELLDRRPMAAGPTSVARTVDVTCRAERSRVGV